ETVRRKISAFDAEQTRPVINTQRSFHPNHANTGVPSIRTSGKTFPDNLRRSPEPRLNPRPNASRAVRRCIKIAKIP
ncbi:hypothetical protein, partial [Acidiphilium sp. 37-64-53]|uniref:hypothetical protein n=1 Tax=Acidiphilium sp. 37-64-53 TaxID=1970299 RepID=UPI0025800F3B